MAGQLMLALPFWLFLSIEFGSPYLEVKVGLLEPGTSHGGDSGLLAARPDANAVWRLGELLLSLGDGSFGLGRRDGGFVAASRHGEGSAGDAQTARDGANGPHLRSSHCFSSRIGD